MLGLEVEVSEVIDRVAYVRKFPVEDRAHAVVVDQQVVEAVVAVHQATRTIVQRDLVAQPMERGLDDRRRTIERLEAGVRLVEPTGRFLLVRQPRAFRLAAELADRNPVQARKLDRGVKTERAIWRGQR